MEMKEIIRGNMATALAAKMARVDVVPAFPITPSTLFPEKISEYIANGELDAEMILVESEHSAISAAIGASAAGARVVTATASQGLALMHEVLFIASAMRLPIVMAIGNRALSGPINIWADHSDTMAERDTGWMQFYAENNQEAFDLMLMAFRIAEDRRVLLPAMVGLDAFTLTHTMEPVDYPSQEEVDDFLPPYQPPYTLDVNRPMTFGSFATPESYMEFKWSHTRALEESPPVIDEIFEEYKKRFGREYKRVTGYMTEDADVIIVAMGSVSGTLREAVRQMRKDGIRVGAVKITTFRPFPFKEIVELCGGAKIVAIAERAISPGFAGPLFGEIAGAFINQPSRPLISDFIIGLGGRDVTLKDFREIASTALKEAEEGRVEPLVKWININPEEAPPGGE
ncbi:MAG: pyruvate ferredoxin oxidoreductase [Thermoplasmata archaeon]|nr:pyruvate ferredoxin oxidoreductase [Thermoplasmata archaeon]